MIVSQDSPRDRLQKLSKRKHRHSLEPSPSTQDDAGYWSSKRQKVEHPTVPPPSFWDSLSELPLCASALRELDRRNKHRELRRKDAAVPSKSKPRRSQRLQSRRATIDDDRLLADRFLRRCSPTTLTEVRRLAKYGGPDLTKLRGVSKRLWRLHPPTNRQQCRTPSAADSEMSSQSSLKRRNRSSQSHSPAKRSATSNTTVTRSTTKAYDPAFQQHLVDHHIYPDRYEYPDGQTPPRQANLHELREVLIRNRASLSPSRFSEEKFESFQRADAHATKENQVVLKVIPFIEGDIGDSKCAANDVAFTNLDHLTDGTLGPGKPDLYYGARPEQLDRSVRRELNGHIIPSSQHDLPIAPNMFLEVKGPDGSAAVAKRQIAYDLALGARGQLTLSSYRAPEPIFDNKAYTIGYTYQDGQLKMFASHPIQPSTPGGEAGYVMTQIDTWGLTGNPEAFRKGAAAYRNGRDWAKQKRDEAIERANKVARDEVDGLDLSFVSVASAANTELTSQDTITNQKSNKTPSLYDSDTSADPADILPFSKRQWAFEDTSSITRASRSVSRDDPRQRTSLDTLRHVQPRHGTSEHG